MRAPATDADFSSRTSPRRLPDETWLHPEAARVAEIRMNLNNLSSGIHQLLETPYGIVEILIRHLPNRSLHQLPITASLSVPHLVRSEIHKALAPGLHLILRVASKTCRSRSIAIEKDHVLDGRSRSELDRQVSRGHLNSDLSIRPGDRELIRQLGK